MDLLVLIAFVLVYAGRILGEIPGLAAWGDPRVVRDRHPNRPWRDTSRHSGDDACGGGHAPGDRLRVGSALALTAAGFPQSLVFGLEPQSLGTARLACVPLAFVAVAACYIPAARAASLEAREALWNA